METATQVAETIAAIAKDIVVEQERMENLKDQQDNINHAISVSSARLANLNRDLVKATNNLHEISKQEATP